MPAKLTSGTVRALETLFEAGLSGEWTDGQLLEQFRSGPGPTAEAAFEALVRRHGAMVLRVCRGVLNDDHDAQDAFQATFLVLVRKAESIRNRLSVANWLYGVAHRVASRAKVDLARRRTHERRAATLINELQHDVAGGLGAERAVLDEEIRRLPEKYRIVVVLCCFEGQSQEQAAATLGWPAGTVRGRLARARELLRTRLSRRGFALPAAAVTAGIPLREDAAIPTLLLGGSLSRSTLLAAAGKPVATGAVSEAALALAGATLKGMTFAGVKLGFMMGGVGLATTAVVGGAVQFGPAFLSSAPAGPEKPPLAVHAEGPADPDPVHVPMTTPTTAQVPASDVVAAPAPVIAPAPKPISPVIASVPPEPETPPVAPEPVPPNDRNLTPRNSVALAFPVEKIEVDGDLNDWPRNRTRYPVSKVLPMLRAPGPGGSDIRAEFAAGYNLAEQLLYLAVLVQDDSPVVGHDSHLDTDAVEIYIDGLRSEKRLSLPNSEKRPYWEYLDLSELPVQQYVAIPGSGQVYGVPESTSPLLLAGDVKRTGTKFAYRRVGNVTTYEWAIQPFDRYPYQPTKLALGKRIGFDVAVVDKDAPSLRGMKGDNSPAWLYWGPQWSGMKVLDASNLGDLMLTSPP